MARRARRARGPFELPPELIPDFDAWGTPAEEAKTAARHAWLDAHDETRHYFFEWAPAHLDERRRLAGLPPRPPSRRKGPLPEDVKTLLARIEAEQIADPLESLGGSQ